MSNEVRTIHLSSIELAQLIGAKGSKIIDIVRSTDDSDNFILLVKEGRYHE